MKRVIVDYSKLTSEILNLLVEKFPDGYDDSDIVRFKNAKNENIEAVEVRTDDTIYLVKISTKLSDRIINFDEDDELAVSNTEIDAIKELGIDVDDAPSEDDDDDDFDQEDKPEFDDEDDEDNDSSNKLEDEDDEDE